ncbi:MAG: CPBP family intramembrane metalloprotease [Deltaproteobacteria bacterium]|nr:CPBP family intramembrane metalloprotease [Deltaproteobacteria bacterium]
MEAGKIDVKTLCAAIAAIVVVELMVVAAVSGDLFHPFLILGIARIVETALIIAIVVRIGKGASSIGLNPLELTIGFKKGLIWAVGFGIVAGISFVILSLFGFNPLDMIQVQLPAGIGVVMMYVIISVFIGPVAEEVFFRGIIYGFFRRWGIIAALIASSLLFILAHSVIRGVPVPQVVGGIVFALAYEIEGSLMVPIIIHILGNMAILIVSLIF